MKKDNENQEKNDEIILSNNELTVSDEAVDDLNDMADERPSFIKMIDNGLEIDGKKFNRVRAILHDAKLYFIKFHGAGLPVERKPYVKGYSNIPEGFERRCDVQARVNDVDYILSLPPTSTTQLAKYNKFLSNENLKLTDMVTELSVTKKTGSNGTYNCIVFEAVGKLDKEKAEGGSLPF